MIGQDKLDKGKRQEDSPFRAAALKGESRPLHHSFAGLAFILFRLGFLGGGINSAVPPLAAIFSRADAEKWWALTTSFLVTSPLPRIRTPSAGPFANPLAFMAAASMVSPSPKAWSRSPTLTT